MFEFENCDAQREISCVIGGLHKLLQQVRMQLHVRLSQFILDLSLPPSLFHTPEP